MNVAPGATFEWELETGITGLTGTLAVEVDDGTGTLTYGPSTDDIIELRTTGTYVATLTAPTVAGQYVLIGSTDGSFDPDTVLTEQLVVTSSTGGSITPSGRDLCVLADVYRYIPGFDPGLDENADTVTTLAGLITAESRGIYRDTGREFVAIPGQDPRTFDLTQSIVGRRSLPIGDIASVESVELFDFDGATSLGVIDPSLYVLEPRTREEWEPYTRIRFPYRPGGLVSLASGRTLQITGTWGFQSIPEDIREACAKLVIIRYFTDSAQAGTDLSDAIDPTFNVSGLTRSALEAVAGYADPGFA